MNLCGRPPYQKGQKPAVVPAMRNAARGQACALMIPGVCNGNPATTVGAHLRWFNLAGMGQKPDDLFIIDACSACHAALDAGQFTDARDVMRALVITQQRRRAAGMIRLTGE